MTIMLDEIKQEPEAIKETYLKETKSVELASETISRSSMVYVTGSGTSFHASAFLSMLLNKAGYPSCAIPASNYDEFFLDRAREKSVNIIFSQSGESTDALSNLSFIALPSPMSGNRSAIMISKLVLSNLCKAAYKFAAASFKFRDFDSTS